MAPRALAVLQRRGAGALLVVSLVAAAGCVGVLLPAAGGRAVDSPAAAAARHGRPDPFPVAPGLPTTSTTTVSPAPAPPASVQVATATVSSLPVYASPGAASAETQLANPNSLGAPLTLLVTSVSGAWVETYLPMRPNESQGWVPMADVTLSPDPYRITISIAARQLTLFQDGTDMLFQVPVATGTPDSPTPLGHFFVADVLKLTDPQDAYGPYALGLSAFSNTYFSFDGGPGQIAVHGTNQPWVIGGYASHGCVRLANPDITRLAQVVPAGTPVDIGL